MCFPYIWRNMCSGGRFSKDVSRRNSNGSTREKGEIRQSANQGRENIPFFCAECLSPSSDASGMIRVEEKRVKEKAFYKLRRTWEEEEQKKCLPVKDWGRKKGERVVRWKRAFILARRLIRVTCVSGSGCCMGFFTCCKIADKVNRRRGEASRVLCLHCVCCQCRGGGMEGHSSSSEKFDTSSSREGRRRPHKRNGI